MSTARSRVAGLSGIVSAILLAIALTTIPNLPSATATPEEIYAFFLEDGSGLRIAAGLLAAAMLTFAGLLAGIRIIQPQRERTVASGAMVAFGLLAIAAQCFYVASLATLSIRAEDSNPSTSATLFDLADAVWSLSGIAFALTLLAAMVVIRRGDGPLTNRLGDAAVLTALACLLWGVRLFTDAGAFDINEPLGGTVGSVALMAWIAACGLWLLSGRVGGRRAPAFDEKPTTQ